MQNHLTMAALLAPGGHSSVSFLTHSGRLHHYQLECLLVGKKMARETIFTNKQQQHHQTKPNQTKKLKNKILCKYMTFYFC